jgi:hypothetical protein
MIGILWRILFMRRLFFVLLFALTALVFSACSSSGGGGSGGNGSNQPLQDISGTVIIPSGHTGDNIQVCDDKNNSNSCDNGETTAEVNTATGSFSITAAYSLVAEFYPAPTSSGTSISARNGVLPVLVYTTPAGESTISAFTTMVKNKADAQPGIYNAISGAEKVKADTGITFDPFNAGSYAANAVLHDKVSAVTAGILEYICDTLNITPDTFSAGVISALYDVVYGIVPTVAANPSSADVDNLVNTNKGIIDANAIAAADNTVGEVWNVGNTISGVYGFFVRESSRIVAVEGGNGETLLPASTLPSSGSFSFSNWVIKKATVTSPANIATSERFQPKTFNLGEEARIYTAVITYDFSKTVQSAEYLRQNLGAFGDNEDLFTGDEIGDVDTYGFDGTFSVTSITTHLYNYVKIDITFDPNRADTDGDGNPQSGDFVWSYSGRLNPFHSTFPFTKRGSFIKIAHGDNEAFKLTTADGSVAILFKDNYGWVLATYPVMDDSFVFFNQAGAQNIIEQWKTDVTAKY